MDNIGTRLRVERERLGLSQTAFAAIAGASKPSQVRYEKGERYPDGLYLEKVASRGVDVQFVLTGERNPALADKSRPLAGDMRIGDQDFSSIKVYDVEAAAGNGLVPSSEAVTDQIAFTRQWLIRHGIPADMSALVRVCGSSMEPTLPDGSYVLVRRNIDTSDLKPGIYIIRLGDEIVVKRLQIDDEMITLVSDNPLYPPIFIHNPTEDRFSPIALVEMVIREL